MMALPSVFATLFTAPATSVAHEVHGAILAKYMELGGPAGPLGYPESDEMEWYDPQSRISLFQHGAITWTAADGPVFRDDKVVHALGLAAAHAFSLVNMPTTTHPPRSTAKSISGPPTGAATRLPIS
jgi:uncharacterized protein with LGFP repeats